MPRQLSTAAKVRLLMRRLGEEAAGPGRVYLVGGASAVLVGWRDTTMDVDLKLAPEPPGVFQAIASAKEVLDMGIPRYPAIDTACFAGRVREATNAMGDGQWP